MDKKTGIKYILPATPTISGVCIMLIDKYTQNLQIDFIEGFMLLAVGIWIGAWFYQLTEKESDFRRWICKKRKIFKIQSLKFSDEQKTLTISIVFLRKYNGSILLNAKHSWTIMSLYHNCFCDKIYDNDRYSKGENKNIVISLHDGNLDFSGKIQLNQSIKDKYKCDIICGKTHETFIFQFFEENLCFYAFDEIKNDNP